MLAALWILSGCLSAPIVPPGFLSVGIESGPLTLDPRFATDATASQIGDLLFQGLTRVDEHARRVPQLALDWETPDAQTYVFHLRSNLRFTDGEPLTAADVRATYASILAPGSRSPKQEALRAIATVEAPDPLTVRFRLRAAFAPFLDATGLGILPRRQIAGSPASPLRLPVGAGPFRLIRFDTDEAVVLQRGDGAAPGAPALRGVVFRVVPDPVTRLLELKRGSLDLVENGVDPDALDWVRRQPHLQVTSSPGTTVQYMGINLRRGPLADARVRRAIAFAIDRRAIVATILKGQATPATGLLSPAHWAYTATVPTYPYDPPRARALLDAAGYPDPDGAGPAPRFRLSYKTTTLELRRRIAEVIQAELAAVGIALDVRTYEWATFYEDIKRGDFQLYSLAWVGIEDPDIYYFTCNSSQQPPAGDNRGGFDDAAIDRLTDAARHTLDPRERRRLYAAVQERVAELLPVIPLWWVTNVAVFNRRLHGFALRPNGSYASLAHAWIRES